MKLFVNLTEFESFHPKKEEIPFEKLKCLISTF